MWTGEVKLTSLAGDSDAKGGTGGTGQHEANRSVKEVGQHCTTGR